MAAPSRFKPHLVNASLIRMTLETCCAAVHLMIQNLLVDATFRINFDVHLMH